MKKFRSFLQRRKSRQSEAPQVPLQQNTQPSGNQPVESQRTVPMASTSYAANNDQAPLNIKATAGTLNIALRNDTTSSTVYASISGLAIDRNNTLFLLQSDGRTPYYPASPSTIQQPLQANVAIALGAPGNTVNVQIPYIAGGRIWFSIGSPITFRLNPGPALVEPSVTNSSDPNANLEWDFAEFTYNSDQLYANISYVDFVSIPISLTLTTVNSGTKKVLGLPTTGLTQIANGLRTQTASDHQGWSNLIVNQPGTSNPLRILSPNQGMVTNSNLFANYFEPYTAQVYDRYASEVLHVDTQAGYGVVASRPASTAPGAGATSNTNSLVIGNEVFARPSTHDIFTCSTGPFATGSDAERNTIIPRLAAAFNRSTLLATSSIPAPSNLYYKTTITNHYSRIVHAANLDGKGYAFPYDDVQATGSADQSGMVNAGDPVLFTLAVGGGRAGQ